VAPRLPGIVVAAAGLAIASGGAADARAAKFTLGIGEPGLLATDPSPPLLKRMRAMRATISRSAVFWRTVAPAGPVRPAGFDARDPASPHYDWSRVDGFVRSTARIGIKPLLAVYAAPGWAEGITAGDRERRRGDAGAYRPSPEDYRDFAYALARRYDGSFPDPSRPGQTLPRVRYFQAWNEPNLDRYLAMPQGQSSQASKHYVGLLNAFYDAVKGVSRSNLVITAGTAPFKFAGADVHPQVFIRRMLCLRRSGGRLRLQPRCEVPRARFDALAHHPYTLHGKPTTRALSRDGGALGNMGQIKRMLDYAERHRRVSPRSQKGLWVTEFGWISDPPARGGVGKPLGVHARYTSESLWRLWRSGVSTVVWFALEDQPDWPGGLYFASGTPKPAAQAFRLPFVAIQRGRGLEFWGMAPGGGRAKIEIARATGKRWRRATVVRSSAGGIFRRRVSRGRAGSYRARVLSGRLRGSVSRPFRTGRR
jgi:hypothetical protein